MVVTSEIRESASGFNVSSISGAEDLLIMDGKLPVVVEVAEVATVKASEVKEVRSNTSWPTPDPTWCRPWRSWGSWPILPIVALPLTTDELLAAALLLSARVADLERTLLEAAAAAAEAASQAGQGRLVLLNRELVSELELLLSLVPVELPNLFLL